MDEKDIPAVHCAHVAPRMSAIATVTFAARGTSMTSARPDSNSVELTVHALSVPFDRIGSAGVASSLLHVAEESGEFLLCDTVIELEPIGSSTLPR